MVMLWVWGILTVCALILEFFTVDLISIWFAAGGLVTLIVTAIFPSLPQIWQCVIFVLVSCVLLLFSKTIFKRLSKDEGEKTNSDALVGKQFTVSKVNKEENYAYHKIGGIEWRIVTDNKEKLADNMLVEVVSIEGNKLVVKVLKKGKGE